MFKLVADISISPERSYSSPFAFMIAFSAYSADIALSSLKVALCSQRMCRIGVLKNMYDMKRTIREGTMQLNQWVVNWRIKKASSKIKHMMIILNCLLIDLMGLFSIFYPNCFSFVLRKMNIAVVISMSPS